ncbi:MULTISPECIES: hypothetical protein [unclassified Geodermatophilus]
MADPAPSLAALHERLREEYKALVRIVSEFDGRLVTVKGWSVTLSLAALGLGFQQEHYALFGLAAASALGFWFIDATMKRHQVRYYSRMRDIEVLAHRLAEDEAADPSSPLGPGAASFSSPRIDWYWGFTGDGDDERLEPPRRRSAGDVARLLHRVPWTGHVLLPHAVAVVLGLVLFVLAVVGVPGLAHLEP